MKSFSLTYMLSDRLKLAMAQAGINANQLAKTVGVSHVAVGNWLSGASKTIKGNTAIKVAAALGIDNAWLMSGVGTMRAEPSIAISEDVGQSGLDVISIPLHVFDSKQGDNNMQKFKQIDGPVGFFSNSFFTSLGIDPASCYRCRVIIDNMMPTLKIGDIVLIDSADRDLRSYKVFAFSNAGNFEIYRIIRQPDRNVVLRSENHAYPDVTIPESSISDSGNISILGRVVLATVFF